MEAWKSRFEKFPRKTLHRGSAANWYVWQTRLGSKKGEGVQVNISQQECRSWRS